MTVSTYLRRLQASITSAISAIDGTPFLTDAWQKPPGELLQGHGITQILEDGPVFERAGCGFSHVSGPRLPPSATQHRPELAGAPFEAMGVSLVFHPRNPYVPTVHMNVRMISATGHAGEPVCWFGGGMDLTPYKPPCSRLATTNTRASKPGATSTFTSSTATSNVASVASFLMTSLNLARRKARP